MHWQVVAYAHMHDLWPFLLKSTVRFVVRFFEPGDIAALPIDFFTGECLEGTLVFVAAGESVEDAGQGACARCDCTECIHHQQKGITAARQSLSVR